MVTEPGARVPHSLQGDRDDGGQGGAGGIGGSGGRRGRALVDGGNHLGADGIQWGLEDIPLNSTKRLPEE